MPAWRGDGRLLAYAASPLAGGSFDVWTVAPDGGPPRRAAERAGGADRAGLHAGGQGHGPDARPGRAVPDEDERLRHAAGRPARAAARPRPARAVPADDRRHEARLRLGDRQRRRGPGLGPRQPADRDRPDARAPSSSGCPTAPCARTPTPAGCATRRRRRTRTGTCSASSATSCARSTGTSSSATARAASASPTTTGWPRGASPRSRAAASTATAPQSNPRALVGRAGHVDRLHRPLPRPLPRPEPRAPRRPGRRLPARPPRQPGAAARGARLHEQRRLAADPAELERRHAARRRRSAPARRSADC